MSTDYSVTIDTILSNENGCCLELLHNGYDPSLWKIRRSRKFLWFRLRPSTFWFYDKQNALTFARSERQRHRPLQKGS